jgi:molybdenum cofactor biosynthesis protein MoaC
MARLTHTDRGGRARMVDVGAKTTAARRAVARGRVRLSAELFRLVKSNQVAKGDVLTVAQIAGIQAGKRASEWIPLCHPIPLDSIDVTLSLDARRRAVVIEAEAATRAATGVEMEAMTAVAAAALTVYDMCKSADRSITLDRIELISKSGGKSGPWRKDGKKK